MKTAGFFLLFAALTAFGLDQDTGLRGTVSPMEAVESITVISGGTDSLKVAPVNGFFTAAVKPGVYQLFIDAAPGFKDMRLERIAVEQGRMTDVGALVLEKILP